MRNDEFEIAYEQEMHSRREEYEDSIPMVNHGPNVELNPDYRPKEKVMAKDTVDVPQPPRPCDFCDGMSPPAWEECSWGTSHPPEEEASADARPRTWVLCGDEDFLVDVLDEEMA